MSVPSNAGWPLSHGLAVAASFGRARQALDTCHSRHVRCASSFSQERVLNAYISALMGLAGVAMGSLASFATTWITQRSQVRERYREVEIAKREKLFSDFIGEATRLYGDALSHQKDDVSDLVLLYALVAQMRLICSRPIVDAAERTMDHIIEAYLAPNLSLHEIADLARSGAMNFLSDFGEVCRMELAAQWPPVQ
ncbi:hypothetical protein FHX16_003577 [Rhizobium sp. BK661]|nr:hypothetical protein [Rhizobium sp. BK661]